MPREGCMCFVMKITTWFSSLVVLSEHVILHNNTYSSRYTDVRATGYTWYKVRHCKQERQLITKTCLYNVDPLKPHFYIVKLGLTGVYITSVFFLFLLKNIDCGFSLEPPRRGGSTSTHNLCFEQKYEKYPNFHLKIFIFGRSNFQYIQIGVFS